MKVSPVQAFKARKNGMEMDGIKGAALRDSVCAHLCLFGCLHFVHYVIDLRRKQESSCST
jgi:hypothetical protein